MAGPTTLYQTGIHSARPAASAGCVLYSCTTHSKIEKSDGSSWTDWLTIPTGSGVATDPVFDAAGDLAQGTGADTAAKLSAGTAGQFLMANGASAALSWASREIDYVEFTSSVNITATVEASANTIVTANALAGDGSTIYVIEFFCPRFRVPAGNNNLNIWLFDGSTSLGFFGIFAGPDAVNELRAPAFLSRRLTPSNASHTYSVRATVSTGTGVADAGAGGTGVVLPGYIRITRAK